MADSARRPRSAPRGAAPKARGQARPGPEPRAGIRAKEQAGLHADIHAYPEGCPPGCPPTLHHSTEHARRVYRLADEGTAAGKPVYGDPTTGQLRIPSGRVFVRFAEGVPAQSRQGVLQQLGYRIEQVPVYAPHAAWLQATDGDIGHALSGITQLEALPDVENVEPQWLTPRAAK